MTSQQSLPGLKVTGYRRVPTELGHPAACCARNDGSCAYAAPDSRVAAKPPGHF